MPKLAAAKPSPGVVASAGGQLAASSELSAAIMDLAAELKGKFGRTIVAQVLGGSKASKLKNQNLHTLSSYGRFAGMSNNDILAAIDALVEQGRLKTTPGPYPKLVVI